MSIAHQSKKGIPELKGKTKPYVIAHRGNQTACPENTLAAFKRAITDGADIIETDIHLTKDEVFVCIHDPTVDRTTNGSGQVKDMTLDELKKLSAGVHREGFFDERIPTLTETTGIIPENVALALELKTDRFLDPSMCERLVSQLTVEKVIDRSVVLSFSMDHLKTFQTVSPPVYTGWITLEERLPKKGPNMLGPYWRIFLRNPFYVFWAHMQKQAVCPLDTTPDTRLWFYKLLGCDAVITDNTEVTCRGLKKA